MLICYALRKTRQTEGRRSTLKPNVWGVCARLKGIFTHDGGTFGPCVLIDLIAVIWLLKHSHFVLNLWPVMIMIYPTQTLPEISFYILSCQKNPPETPAAVEARCCKIWNEGCLRSCFSHLVFIKWTLMDSLAGIRSVFRTDGNMSHNLFCFWHLWPNNKLLLFSQTADWCRRSTNGSCPACSLLLHHIKVCMHLLSKCEVDVAQGLLTQLS